MITHINFDDYKEGWKMEGKIIILSHVDRFVIYIRKQ